MVRRGKRNNEKEIQIVFPLKDLKSDERYTKKGDGKSVVKYLSANIDEFRTWFSSYKIESIELTISGTIETGNLIKLIVGAKGEGGATITLKPKQD